MRREEADSLQLEATRILLDELAEILNRFDGAVIAGGTVPLLLIPQDAEQHEGTVDVDVVLDLERLRGDPVQTFHEMLDRRLFIQDNKRPFRYTKAILIGGEQREGLIELLAGGTPTGDGLQRIPGEDVYVSVIEGMQIALDNPVSASSPGGGTVQVTSLAGFLAMKAFALERREPSKKAKDAYDIIYCLRNYPGGVDAIAAEMKARLPNVLLAEGIARLKFLFASQVAIGPSAYASRAQSDKEQSLMRREAFEYVSDLLDRLP